MLASRTVLLLLALVHLATALEATEAASRSSDRSLIDWDPSAVNFSPDCAKIYWRGRGGFCIFEMVVDSGGKVHVFIVKPPPLRNVIDHFEISKGEIHQLDPVLIPHGDVVSLRAAAGPSGEIHLLKAETLDRITLQPYENDRWGDERSILDEKARPWVDDSSDFALSVGDDGTIDVFWRDIREYSFLADMLSMGHAGNFDKTYHRVLKSSGWSKAEQVQARGRSYEPDIFRPIVGHDGSVGLLWSSASSSGARIVRSTLVKRKWSEVETVGKCSSNLSDPSIFDMEILGGSPDGTKVAWTCFRYEYTEPGTRKNDAFSNLYVSSLIGGTWQSGPQLSRNVSTFRWLGSRGGKSLLLLQETSGHGPNRKRNVPLYALEIDGNRSASRVQIAEHTVEGFLETASTPDGTFHLVYAVPTSDSEATLVYRKGKLVDK